MTQTLLILGMCNNTPESHSANWALLSIDDVADYIARLALTGTIA
jgi:hypothetical protein